MKTMYCWRCQMDMPMLDEDEFKIISELYSDAFRVTKESRQEHYLPLNKCTVEDRFRPLLQKYYELTGFEETVPAAIMHHRILFTGRHPNIAVNRCETRKPRFVQLAVNLHPKPRYMQTLL